MSTAAGAALPPVFYVERSDRGRLRLTGRDRQSFLQGMVTNDVGRLTPGAGCYAFQCDATGHVLADLRVLCLEDALLLDTEPGMAEQVAATLEKYLIMERVKIADVSSEYESFLVFGEGAPALLAGLGVSDAAADWHEGRNVVADVAGVSGVVAAAVRLVPGPAFELLVPAGQGGAARTALAGAGARESSAADVEALRIEAGVPRYGADIDAKVLAPETGQQARAISYKKGCYIGQEIVARIDARGHTNRAFAGFSVSEGATPGAAVTVDGKEVGRITSVAVSPTLGVPIALGYVRNEHGTPGTMMEVAGAPAQVAALPFVGTVVEGETAP
jgi:folate-binding protein YgfZ